MPRDGMHPTATHVGQRVRMRRLMLGMSQAHVADALGLTFQQLQKYEKGINRISASRLQQIAHVFRVPAAFFFEGAPMVPGEERAQADAPLPKFVRTILLPPTGSTSPKLSCRFRTQSFGVRSSIWWSRSPAPRISESSGPEISEASPAQETSSSNHRTHLQSSPQPPPHQPKQRPPHPSAPPRKLMFSQPALPHSACC
jgi:transcriptional regulator with XRE-family HTH domain